MNTKHSWLKSIAINAIILITMMLCTHVIYETNDEFAIASRITDGYAEVNFVNYYLCRILVYLSKLMPSVNVYVVAQIACAFISFVCILKLIIDKAESKMIIIVSAAVITVFSIDHYCTIQFTKTAAVLIVAGTLMMMDSIASKRGIGYYLLSIILLYTGVAFRIDGLIAAVGFAGLYLLKWLWDNRKTLVKDGFFTTWRIILYVLLIAVIGGCYGFDHLSYNANIASDELRDYKQYSILRSAVVDYPLYEYYEDNADAYAEIGISENDLNLIDHWYFDYDGAASVENLTNIVAVDSADERPAYTVSKAVNKFKKETIRSLKKLDYTGSHLIILFMIAVWMLISLSPRHWLYIFATGGLAACMYLALYYMQRPEYRALYIADIGAAMWLLYAASVGYKAPTESQRNLHSIPMKIMGVCIIIASVMLMLPAHHNIQKSFDKASRKVMPSEMTEYIQAHDDSFFVFGTQEKKSSASYITPLKAPDTYADRNIMGAGSWGTMSPYVLNKLRAYDMENPIRDLIDNDKAYYVGNKRIKRLTEYYNKWYGGEGKTIVMDNVDNVGGYNIWQIRTVTG